MITENLFCMFFIINYIVELSTKNAYQKSIQTSALKLSQFARIIENLSLLASSIGLCSF